jgi:hypothetical protein
MNIRRIRRRLAAWVMTREDHEIVQEALDLYADIIARRNVARKDEDHDWMSVRTLTDDMSKRP